MPGESILVTSPPNKRPQVTCGVYEFQGMPGEQEELPEKAT